MRCLLLSFAVLSLVVPASAAAQTRRAADEKQIIANERRLNEAFAKGDGAGFQAMLAPGAFVLNPATGVMKAADVVPMLRQAKFDSWNIDQSRVHFIDPNTAIHTFRWTGKATFMGQPIPPVAVASTIWVKKGGKWLALFHQETPGGPPPAPKK